MNTPKTKDHIAHESDDRPTSGPLITRMDNGFTKATLETIENF